ncbi:MAG: hypothetical protein JNL92_18210 [Opitutaceae bacterium]|nr:hypothetical protein [Opitutaceae bacterium]
MSPSSRCSGPSSCRRTLLPVAALLAALPLLAAPATLPGPDDDWRALQALLTRDPLPAAATLRTAAARTAAVQLRAARLQQAARQAQEFHTRHASNPHAPAARKIEVAALIERARLDADPVSLAQALDRAASFRADPSLLREHRFEVALAAERLRHQHAKGAQSVAAEEQVADALRREFGPIPEVHGLYAGLAAAAPMATANRLATQLLEMRPAPAVRAAAEAITTRYGLVGRPFTLRLTRLDATAFELPAKSPAPGPTVLYVWSPGHAPLPGAFAALNRHRGRLPANLQWIYVGVGVPPAEARAAVARAPFAGVHCRDDAGPRSALAQKLRLTRSPMVFVLNRQGVLTGFGRVDELPALLAAAGR